MTPTIVMIVAMIFVHEQMHKRAGQYEQVWQYAEQVSLVAGQHEDSR